MLNICYRGWGNLRRGPYTTGLYTFWCNFVDYVLPGRWPFATGTLTISERLWTICYKIVDVCTVWYMTVDHLLPSHGTCATGLLTIFLPDREPSAIGAWAIFLQGCGPYEIRKLCSLLSNRAPCTTVTWILCCRVVDHVIPVCGPSSMWTLTICYWAICYRAICLTNVYNILPGFAPSGWRTLTMC